MVLVTQRHLQGQAGSACGHAVLSVGFLSAAPQPQAAKLLEPRGPPSLLLWGRLVVDKTRSLGEAGSAGHSPASRSSHRSLNSISPPPLVFTRLGAPGFLKTRPRNKHTPSSPRSWAPLGHTAEILPEPVLLLSEAAGFALLTARCRVQERVALSINTHEGLFLCEVGSK